nr:odorant receptor 15 [Graphosoma rubrolineatum]
MHLTDKDYLLKGYKGSQCFLLRIGAMYVLQDENEIYNWIFVGIFHMHYYVFLFWILPYDVGHTIPMGHMTATLQALHYYCTFLGYSIVNYLYHFNRKSVNYCLTLIGKDFFKYEEGETELEMKIAQENDKKQKEYIKKLTRYVMVIVFATAFAVLMLPTFAELLTRTEPIPDDEVMNPYLPIPLVLPWDSFTVGGYILIYVLLFLVSYNITTELLALSMGYTSFLIIYTSQFKILNKSVLKIEERATNRYRKVAVKQLKGMEKFDDPIFQECMNSCLKQNIKHHQILLKWMDEACHFLGWGVLCTIFTTSFLLAASGFLITMESDSSLLKSLILVQVQILELLHAYLFCWWGENLATESAKLYHSLYKTPWFYCGKRFNRLVQIMMSNASKPVIPKDPLFKINASLEVYMSILSTGYSYFNLLRSMN